MINQHPTVSICCITYNHVRFIAHAMEGFIMQQTNVKVNILRFAKEMTTGQTHANYRNRLIF